MARKPQLWASLLLIEAVLAGCSAGHTTSAVSPPTATVVPPASTSASPLAPPPSPSPVATYPGPQGTVLVFQVRSQSNYHISLATKTGEVYKSLDETVGGSDSWQGDGGAMLLDGPNGSYSVLDKKGTISAILPSVVAGLAVGTAGDPILVDSQTMLAIVGQGSPKYELADVLSGGIITLIAVTPTQPTRGVQPPILTPLGLSADHSVARVLIRHAKANATDVPQWAIIEIDLTHKAVTAIKQLPIASDFDSYDAAEPAITRDGRLFAYMRSEGADAQNFAIFRTHIVDVATGRDTSVPDTSIQLVGNSRGLRFSPDGSALVAYGLSWPHYPQDSMLIVYSTTDGRVFQRIDAGDRSSNAIEPVGWIGDHNLVYKISTAASPGVFMDAPSSAHTVDVISGATSDLPGDIGTLATVLN